MSTATVDCREYAMKNIADLLRRVWQRSQPGSNTQVAIMTENRDRSSMADFVRILRAFDQDGTMTAHKDRDGSFATEPDRRLHEQPKYRIA